MSLEMVRSAVPPIEPALHPKIVTTVHLSVSAWAWLKRTALDEAERDGGRPNASSIIERLIRTAAKQ